MHPNVVPAGRHLPVQWSVAVLLGDWLILIGTTLLAVGVIGLTMLTSDEGPSWSDATRPRRVRRPSIEGLITSPLPWWHPGEGRRPVPRGDATAVRIDPHDLTDHVCRLADGSMGRVAIVPGTDEAWTAICVAV